jgi:hypothetical protein
MRFFWQCYCNEVILGDILTVFSLIFVRYYECADFSKNMQKSCLDNRQAGFNGV